MACVCVRAREQSTELIAATASEQLFAASPLRFGKKIMCDATCRLDLAAAVCSLLTSTEKAGSHLPRTVQVFGDFHTSSLFQLRPGLQREMGCIGNSEEQPSDVHAGSSAQRHPRILRRDPPALRGKAVENGKSAMSFLVPGGEGVDPMDSGTFGVIFKQVNPQESTLLSSLSPQLTQHYVRRGGSLLTPLLSWLRYTPLSQEETGAEGAVSKSSSGRAAGGRAGAGSGEASRVFEVLMMENAARTPPGRVRFRSSSRGDSNSSAADAAASTVMDWKPFDMKGIKLYKHEQRFVASFGAAGLHVGGAHLEALREAVDADVRFLSERRLVDFSYLLSVFPTGGRPRPCHRAWRDADYHMRRGWAGRGEGDASARGGGGILIPATYRVPTSTSSSGGGGGNSQPGTLPAASKLRQSRVVREVPRSPSPAASGGDMCVPVLARLAIIDYLREWSMAERMEHVQKTIMRDIVAGERNHAVVPVRQFAERFAAYFSETLFTPLPHPTGDAGGWAQGLRDAWHDAKAALSAGHAHLDRLTRWRTTGGATGGQRGTNPSRPSFQSSGKRASTPPVDD